MTKKIKIAVANDYEIFREGLINILDSFEEFKVTLVAENGAELMDALEHTDSLPDICIFDVGLPIVNGYDSLKAIKDKWPSVKVLMLSMLNNEASVIRMMKIGANGFLVKGSSPEEMEQALLSIYHKDYYYANAIPDEYVEHGVDMDMLKLTYREMDFLSLCSSELNYKGIADRMGVSVKTVEGYRDALYEKLHIKNRIGLVIFAINMGMISTARHN